MPKEWILLERTILLVMGLCTELDPDLNPTKIVRPYVEEFRFWRRGGLVAACNRLESRNYWSSAIALPADLRKFMHRALQGELELKLVGQTAVGRLQYAAAPPV